MVYSTGRKKRNGICKIMEYETNDVWIAKDIPKEKCDMGISAAPVCVGQGTAWEYYTVLVIKKHETAKLLMEIREAGKKSGRGSCGQYVACQDKFCVAYPYQKDRPLERFYKSEVHSGEECQKICRNLVTECMCSKEPWPVLYLILKQRQIHIRKDGCVSLGYQIDLGQLNPNVGEQACAVKCAEMILELVQEDSGMEKTAGMELLCKKIQKEGYLNFIELLQDIHIDFPFQKKGKTKERIGAFFRKKRALLVRAFLTISLLTGMAAFFMLCAQMALGEIPFLRIFTSSFEKIGRESLIR